MEKKKPTDEEVIRLLEIFANDNEPDGVDRLARMALDLIHRLQGENERLKKPRKYILANKVYTDSTLKGWTKEDLIEQIRILEHNWACAEESLNNSAKNSQKIIAEQKAEIERLTEERDKAKRDNTSLTYAISKVETNNAKLQKQVDELTDKLGKVLSTVGIDEYKQSKAIEQAVEERTKEIVQGFNKWANQAISESYDKCVKAGYGYYGGQNNAFHEVKGLIQRVAKYYGVEVE